MKLNIAIIGCGDTGNKHASAWKTYNDINIVAVCDKNIQRANLLAKKYGANVYTSWQNAVAQKNVDIVSVCLPICFHRDVTVTSATLGKHILCEKAMALSLEEANDMIRASKKYNVRLLVCHQYRGISRFKVMKGLIKKGLLGYPLNMRFTEMREVRPKLEMHELHKNGGPLHDFTGHLFDLARYLTDSEAINIVANGTINGKNKKRLKTISKFGIDTAELLARFDGGHSLSIGLSWGLPENTPGHSQELIYGPNGMIYSYDPENTNRFIGDLSDSVQVIMKDSHGISYFDCDKDNDGPHVCISELIDAIKEDKPSQFDGNQGREALNLIIASLRAIKTGELVYIK